MHKLSCGARAAVRSTCVALVALLLAGKVEAQIAPAGDQNATRAQLTEQVKKIESQIASNSLRGDARPRALSELAAIRNRLDRGDFRVGDRFILTIRQDSVRSDTVDVRDSLLVSVLNIPPVSVAGVLRSELNAKMGAHVARFLRNVDVNTNILTRVSILGAVQRPGFYYAAPDRPLSDLVMVAGGPGADANLAQLEIVRGSAKLLKAKDSKKLLKEGRTLEQLDVQSGDEVRIPQKRKFNWGIILQMMFLLSSLIFTFVNFLRWYYDRQDG